MSVQLEAEALDQLAQRIADLLAPRLIEALSPASGEDGDALVDAATAARALGVTRAWVYEHADGLGAVRLGKGDRPRLRFDLERGGEGIARSREPSKPPARRNGRRRSERAGAPLLQIRGRH